MGLWLQVSIHILLSNNNADIQAAPFDMIPLINLRSCNLNHSINNERERKKSMFFCGPNRICYFDQAKREIYK